MVRRHGFGVTLNMNMNNIEQSLNRLVALANAAEDSTRIAGLLVGRLVNRLYAQGESAPKSCKSQPES